MEIVHLEHVPPDVQAQWNELCHETTRAMERYCLPFVTPISHAISVDEGKLEGTGAYLEFAEKRFLISNEHVLHDWKTREFTHQFFGCEEVFPLCGPPSAIEKHPVDAALWQIPAEVWQKHPHQATPVPFSRLAERHAPVPGELLFICGYPQQRSQFYFKTLVSRATQLLTQERQPPTVDNLDANYFLLAYSPEYAQSVDPSSGVPLSNPPGLSGSLLWNTRRIECLSQSRTWSPDLAHVTGMLVRWDPPLAAVQAVRIEVLRQFLERHVAPW